MLYLTQAPILETLWHVISDTTRNVKGVCYPCAGERFEKVDHELSVSSGPHEHSRMSKEYAINCKPIKCVDLAVKLRGYCPDKLTTPGYFDSNKLFNRKTVRIIDVCRIMNYWPLKMGYVLHDVSILTHLFLSTVDEARDWIAEHNIVAIDFDYKAEVT